MAALRIELADLKLALERATEGFAAATKAAERKTREATARAEAAEASLASTTRVRIGADLRRPPGNHLTKSRALPVCLATH